MKEPEPEEIGSRRDFVSRRETYAGFGGVVTEVMPTRSMSLSLFGAERKLTTEVYAPAVTAGMVGCVEE